MNFNIFSDSLNFIKDYVSNLTVPKKQVFKVGEGLNTQQQKKAEEIVRKQPTEPLITQKIQQTKKTASDIAKQGFEAFKEATTIKEEPKLTFPLSPIGEQYVKKDFIKKTDSGILKEADVGSGNLIEDALLAGRIIKSSQPVEPETKKWAQDTLTNFAFQSEMTGGINKVKSNAINKIAKSKNFNDIFDILKNTFNIKNNKELTELSSQLKNIKNPQKVQNIIDSIKPQEIKKPTEGIQDIINTDRLKLKPEQKQNLNTFIERNSDDINQVLDGKLTFKDIQKKAQDEQRILSKVITKKDTERMAALDLNARKRETELANKIYDANTTPEDKKIAAEELLNVLKITKAEGADVARRLGSRRIVAEGGDNKSKLVTDILNKMEKSGVKVDEMAEQISKVNWNDYNSVVDFYRSYIKPTNSEILKEFRYNNALSNPRTQLRNLFGNLNQALVVRPATKAVEAGLDFITSPFNSKQRNTFFKDVPKYYQGLFKNIPKATDEFFSILSGKSPIEQLDVDYIPTKKLGFLSIPTKTLEATDRYLMKVISGAEESILRSRGMSPEKAAKKAEDISKYSLFREEYGAKGQGYLLKGIDEATKAIDHLRKKVPGGDWFMMFLRTPMNIAKQWIEYSPAGLATIPGAKAKKEQLAKMLIGSTFTAIGAKLAWEGNTTWSAPTDPEAKNLFYASGKKPYSIKVGDKWLPMIYFGPLAFSLAIPAAIKYNYEDQPKALTDSQVAKLTKSISSIGELLSQQTFMEGLGNWVNMLNGDQDQTLEKNLSFTAGQMIPLQGLIRYISTIVDPIYRKADGVMESFAKDIPFLSFNLEAYKEPTGEPSKRNLSSYILPYDVTIDEKQYDEMLNYRNEQLQINDFLRRNDEKLNREAINLLDKFNSSKTDEDMKEIVSKLEGNEQLKNTFKALIKKQAEYTESTLQPIMMFKDDPTAIAKIIYGRFSLAKNEEETQEVNNFIKQLKDAGIWNDKVSEALKKIIIADTSKEQLNEEQEQKTEEEPNLEELLNR